MNVMHCFCKLIDDISFVLLPQHILADECVHVDVHQLEKDINIPLILRTDHLFYFHDVRVVESLQKHYLSVRPLRVS
jgi:hypothetical protein